MIEEIVTRARTGGRQAIAAPRGIGKSELTKGLLVYLVLAGLVRFPLAVAATAALAARIYKDFKSKLETSDLLRQDFPEVCDPIRALEGAPQRASRQHIDGQLTRIVWTGDYLSLPCVPWNANDYLQSLGESQPGYGGIKMAYYGLDAAFRGVNIESCRPDFVLIDDPETRESARSRMQSEDREEIIDKDIAGLASQEDNLAILVLTTVQNRFSLSYRLATPELKPAFNGRLFGMVLRWPNHMEMWDKYVELRKESQIRGDHYGIEAVDYYLENRQRMDAGVEMLSDHYVEIITADGRSLVHSAIQQAFNKIADTSKDAYFTEYQNDPPEAAGPQGMGLTAEIVVNRLSGLERRQLPANTMHLTAGIDLGKYWCHWVVAAWWKGAGGCVVDYGVAEVAGTSESLDTVASEPLIYKALLNWRDQLLQAEYVDATGIQRKIDAVFVDSGTFTNAAYEFVRQVGAPFHAVKGIGNYRPRRESNKKLIVGDHMHAAYQDAERLWLFDLSTDYWKNWVHERFLTPAFDTGNMLRRGSLSLFNQVGRKTHMSFAQHIVAEELVAEFIEGKGTKVKWHQHNPNNHWLDATYYAAAAARFQGVHLLSESEVKNEPRELHPEEKKPKPTVRKRRQHGANLNRRPGGWMQSIKGRRP